MLIFRKDVLGWDPYILKGKSDIWDTGYYVGQGDGDMLFFGSGNPSPSGMQAHGYTKREAVHHEAHGNPVHVMCTL